MSSSRRDGTHVVVMTGDYSGHQYVIVDPQELGLEPAGREPSDVEQQEAGRHFFVRTAELNRERRRKRERPDRERDPTDADLFETTPRPHQHSIQRPVRRARTRG